MTSPDWNRRFLGDRRFKKDNEMMRELGETSKEKKVTREFTMKV